MTVMYVVYGVCIYKFTQALFSKKKKKREYFQLYSFIFGGIAFFWECLGKIIL